MYNNETFHSLNITDDVGKAKLAYGTGCEACFLPLESTLANAFHKSAIVETQGWSTNQVQGV